MSNILSLIAGELFFIAGMLAFVGFAIAAIVHQLHRIADSSDDEQEGGRK